MLVQRRHPRGERVLGGACPTRASIRVGRKVGILDSAARPPGYTGLRLTLAPAALVINTPGVYTLTFPAGCGKIPRSV